jgi:hypothetical protein
MAHPYNAIAQRTKRRINGESVPAAPTAIRRVTWTAEEIEKVARASFGLRSAGSLVEAVKRAQLEVLPPERHRQIRQEKDFQATIVPIWKTLKAEAAPAEPKVPEAPEAPVASLGEVSVERVPEPAEDEPPAPGAEIVADEPSVSERLSEAAEEVNAGTRAEVDAEKKASRGMVRWDHEEKLLIARESKRLREGFSNMSELESIRKAIAYSMPEARQRGIGTMSQVEWITGLWQQIETEERAAKAEQLAEAAREQAAQAQRAEAEAKRTEFDPLSLSFETLIKAIGAKIAHQVIGSIGEHLTETVMQRIDETLRQAIPQAPLPEGVTRLHAAPRNRKPRVLIVGLLNQQANDVEDAMNGLLHLDFVKAEHSDPAALETKARNSDLTILMTRFISHKHQDAVKRVSDRVVYRNGSVSELKKWLTQWINGEVLTAA